MKTKIFFTTLLLVFAGISSAQNIWFKTHKDSTTLIQEANLIKDMFVQDINSIRPELEFSLKTTLKTSPMLIYYNDKTAYLPLWEQLPEQMKNWFYAMGGDTLNGQKIFGLFFNGFYLPHELAHGFEDALKKLNQSYKNEYFANTAAILWLRKHNYNKQLKECYEVAKDIMSKTPNPVPEEQSIENYFTDNYENILQNGDPSVYGYMQFGQFIKIYEDETLPDFDTYIKSYLSDQ